jgi:hypothetical protein
MRNVAVSPVPHGQLKVRERRTFPRQSTGSEFGFRRPISLKPHRMRPARGPNTRGQRLHS